MLVSTEKWLKYRKGFWTMLGASCKINLHGDCTFLIDVSEFAGVEICG